MKKCANNLIFFLSKTLLFGFIQPTFVYLNVPPTLKPSNTMSAQELETKSIKQLKRLQSKIEKEIAAKEEAKDAGKELYEDIKEDFAQHKRPDGRKTFRGVVDYLECQVRGLPPVTRSKFFARFGITGRRAKVTAEVLAQVKAELAAGKTLKASGEAAGVSIATAQKIKNGDYDN